MEQFSLNALLLYKDEFIFLMFFSLLGVFIHESTTKKVRLFPFLLTFDNYIVSFVVSVICFGVEPYVAQISDRIIIVLPIILGMAGKEILSRLLTLQGSTSLLEYGLGFLGIVNEAEKEKLGIPTEEDIANSHHQASGVEKEEEKYEPQPSPSKPEELHCPHCNTDYIPQEVAESESPSVVTPITQYENYVEIDNMVHSSLDSICNLVVDYYAHHDVESFLRGYHTLNVTMEILNHKLAQKQNVPVPTVLKMFEIGKKQTEIDLIYNQIINDIRKEKE